MMLRIALKEWAVICEALGQGRQSVLLRKGPADEPTGSPFFDVKEIWLYPTYPVEQAHGINDETQPLLKEAEAERPPAGTVRLRYWAAIETIYRIREELPALLLSHLHCWSQDAVGRMFHDKTPGLYLLVLRVYRMPKPHEIAVTSAHERPGSWVELEQALPTDGAAAVLDDESFRIVRKQLDLLLSPTGFA
jgi:hypothetical protein